MSKYDDHRHDKLSDSERRDVDEAMHAARGLPGHAVARIASKYHRAVNYYGCGKRHIFIDMVEDGALDRPRDNRIVGGTDQWTRRTVWWNDFLQALRNEPRPPTRAQRKLAKGRAEREERKRRLREAEGWTLTEARTALQRVDELHSRLTQQLDETRDLRDQLHRIIQTLVGAPLVILLTVLLGGCWLDFGSFAVCDTPEGNPCPDAGAPSNDGAADALLDGRVPLDSGPRDGGDSGLDSGAPVDAGPLVVEALPMPQGASCDLGELAAEDGRGALLARVDGPPLELLDGRHVTGCVRLWGPVRRVVARQAPAACGAACEPSCDGEPGLLVFDRGLFVAEAKLGPTWMHIAAEAESPVTLCRDGAGAIRGHVEVDYAGE